MAVLPVSILIISVFSVNKWSDPIQTTINEDDDYDDINTIWSKIGLKYWFRHITTLSVLRYRWIKSLIVLRMYSAHTAICKGAIALVVSTIAYSLSDQSPILAASTTFYATMIFLRSEFEYAALWPQSLSTTRYDYGGVTDALGVATNIKNVGQKKSESIQAKLRVIDAPRGLSGDTTPDDSDSYTLESKLNRDYSFTFAGEDDSVRNVRNRASMNGVIGEIAFAVVEIQTPHQPVPAIKYKNISNVEIQTEEELQEIMQGLADGFSILNEYTSRKFTKQENEDQD